MNLKPNCFEKTKVRWGIFKKLSPTKLHSEQSAPLAANGSGIKEGGIRSTHFHPTTKLNKMNKTLINHYTPLSFNAMLPAWVGFCGGQFFLSNIFLRVGNHLIIQ